jgi:hypothetical protein
MPISRDHSDLQPEVLTMRDARVYLNISKAKLYSEINQRRIVTFLRGKFRLVRRSVLEAYLDQVTAESHHPDGSPKKDPVMARVSRRPRKSK